MLVSPAMDAPFRIYVVACIVLCLQLLALGGWTGAVRLSRKKYVSPEDAKAFKGSAVDAEDPEVQRVKRAHLNALENAVPFIVVGAFYIPSANKQGALAYCVTFVAARLLHSVFYLWGKQPWRTLMFIVGTACTVGMAVQVLMHLS